VEDPTERESRLISNRMFALFRLGKSSRQTMENAALGIELPFAERTGAHLRSGTQAKADTVEIQWPSGQVDQLLNVNAGQTVRIEEGKGIVGASPYRPPSQSASDTKPRAQRFTLCSLCPLWLNLCVR
jgi:hypothetical protein